HARQINELSVGEHIEQTVTDHDAEDRATLNEEGIYSQNAAKDVSPGIQAVMQRLRPGHDGKPRIFFFRNALVEVDETLDAARKPLCTEQEFPGYVWQHDTSGKPVKEAPVKVNDHGVDAVRYAVMYVDGGAGTATMERWR
ncbi:MAG: terminase, partial [Anaerolineae bacterium]|nr:terminase [Anaerolineae bacterium]